MECKRLTLKRANVAQRLASAKFTSDLEDIHSKSSHLLFLVYDCGPNIDLHSNQKGSVLFK